MELEPLQDVLILELIENDVTEGGIVLPENFQGEKQDGTVFRVLASGPGVWDGDHFVPNKIKVDDLIITASYGVSKFTYKGKKIILARERDVILRVKKGE